VLNRLVQRALPAYVHAQILDEFAAALSMIEAYICKPSSLVPNRPMRSPGDSSSTRSL